MKYLLLSFLLVGCASEVVEKPTPEPTTETPISTSGGFSPTPTPTQDEEQTPEEEDEDTGCKTPYVVEESYLGCKFYLTYCADEGRLAIPYHIDQTPCFGAGEVSPVPQPGDRRPGAPIHR